MVQTSSRLFHLVCFVNRWRICLVLVSKGLYQSSGKAKEGRCLVFTASTKRRIIINLVVVVQRRQGNVRERMMQVQSFVLHIKPIVFFRRSRRRRVVEC